MVGSGQAIKEGHGNANGMLGSDALEIGCNLAALAIDNRRLYDTLLHQSESDQLTNVGNRFLFQRRLDEMLRKALQSGSEFAMIYVDIDRFKQVNDVYGHRVGDIYLQQIASRMANRLRETDTLARIGGDEFVALIPELHSRDEAAQIAQRLSQCFEAPFGIENTMLRGSASIGIAIFPEDGMGQEELKRVADARMYAHKRAEIAS
jgi:diguanylate cyclase (GGDEF)-like protein